ncbi:MAG: superoxide dismutase, partial [Dehalococcoidia bacterium]|nr:superoxide dismutase [Dehalococcoidia bacterium]
MVETKDTLEQKAYTLPALPYAYTELQPFISEEQLKIHHTKHHQAYVDGANSIFERLGKARKEAADIDMKATLKELSFHLGGHELHSAFWKNMAPVGKGGGGKPTGTLCKYIDQEFGGFDRFKKEFTQAAISVEGSGWAVLTYCSATSRLAIMQVEKHNVNFPAGYSLLMCLDVWEHAYYLKYQ